MIRSAQFRLGDLPQTDGISIGYMDTKLKTDADQSRIAAIMHQSDKSIAVHSRWFCTCRIRLKSNTFVTLLHMYMPISVYNRVSALFGTSLDGGWRYIK